MNLRHWKGTSLLLGRFLLPQAPVHSSSSVSKPRVWQQRLRITLSLCVAGLTPAWGALCLLLDLPEEGGADPPSRDASALGQDMLPSKAIFQLLILLVFFPFSPILPKCVLSHFTGCVGSFDGLGSEVTGMKICC